LRHRPPRRPFAGAVAEYKLRAEVRDTLEVVPLYHGAADDVHRLYSGVCVDI
jgi:hypothetical protein